MIWPTWEFYVGILVLDDEIGVVPQLFGDSHLADVLLVDVSSYRGTRHFVHAEGVPKSKE